MVRKPSEWLKIVKEYRISNISMTRLADKHGVDLAKLKYLIVAKGNHNVLATYVIHSNSKNSKKSKMVKSMYRVYHESQRFNWLKSWSLVIRYALYSRKKYKNVQ